MKYKLITLLALLSIAGCDVVQLPQSETDSRGGFIEIQFADTTYLPTICEVDGGSQTLNFNNQALGFDAVTIKSQNPIFYINSHNTIIQIDSCVIDLRTQSINFHITGFSVISYGFDLDFKTIIYL